MKVLTPFIIIIICIAGYFIYISPLYSDIKTLSAQKSYHDGVSQKAQELILKRDAILDEYNAIPPEDIERLKKVIPDEFSTINVATYINNIALKSGLMLKNFKVSEVKTEDQGKIVSASKDPYRVSYISFSVSGPYDKFLQFLRDLENSLYLFDVIDLSINSSAKDSSSFDYNISLKAYSIK